MCKYEALLRLQKLYWLLFCYKKLCELLPEYDDYASFRRAVQSVFDANSLDVPADFVLRKILECSDNRFHVEKTVRNKMEKTVLHNSHELESDIIRPQIMTEWQQLQRFLLEQFDMQPLLGSIELTDAEYEMLLDNFRIEYIKDFNYRFENSGAPLPYMFVPRGSITVQYNGTMLGARVAKHPHKNEFGFELRADEQWLKFDIPEINGCLHIEIPMISYRMDNGEWTIARPEEMWLSEFPSQIEFRCSNSEIILSVDENTAETSQSVVFSKGKKQDMTSLTSISLPSTLTEIGSSAFSGCTGLTAIYIGSNVTYIANDAFYNHNSKLTIYGEAGSYAETYAKNNNIHFIAGKPQ